MQPITTPTVLVAEDDDDIRELVCIVVRRAGYRVHSVGSGDEALAAARLVRPVLAVLDVNMPDRDGLEVCLELKRDGSTAVPVLVMSADCREERVAAAYAAGADDFIAKPFVPREFSDRALRLLSSRLPALEGLR